MNNMNIPMQPTGPMGMNQMVPTNPVQLASAQHGMHPSQTPIQQTQEKFDNISKVKALVGPLRDSLSNALKSAAQTLHQNSLIDTSKGIESPDQQCNKKLEEFYSYCDQIELHLRTSLECLSQNSSSVRYMPIPVAPVRNENMGGPPEALTYPQFLTTVRSQVQYTRDIYNAIHATARAISTTDN